MQKVIRFTFLGFHLNSIKDSGLDLNLEETEKHLDKKTLFPFLKEKFGSSLDISIYTPTEIEEMEEFFSGLYCSVDAERKFGIKNDGLSLLIAYCLEGVQQDY